MARFNLSPIIGINLVAHDEALRVGGRSKSLYVRDAVNVDITEVGTVKVRKSGKLVTDLPYIFMWQSPLHKDVFAVLNHYLVLVDRQTLQPTQLAYVGQGFVSYEVVNNLVVINSPVGLLSYNGQSADPYTISTPPPVFLGTSSEPGTLPDGTYHVAVSWLCRGKESGLSVSEEITLSGADRFDQSRHGISVILPTCLDDHVDGVRVYASDRSGGELLMFADYPIDTARIDILSLSQLGMSARYIGLSPMPPGKMMSYWQGRLVVGDRNVLRFSEPMAYHLHDQRYGFLMMPQQVTFIAPVDGGIWVGQVTHVVFISGNKPSEMQFNAKSSHAPVAQSAMLLDADDVGGELSQGGGPCAIWLSDNGYVLGTSSGQLVEMHQGKLKNIVAKKGKSVRFGRRITTIVS